MMASALAALVRGGRRWESLCLRCGVCCYEKVRRDGELVVDWARPCRWLDTASRRCTVYGRRFEVCQECRRMTVRHALFSSWLPEGCGYVRAFRSRQPRQKARARRPDSPRQGAPCCG